MAGSIAKLVVSLGANVSDFETNMKRASSMSKRELYKMEQQSKKLNATWNRNFKLAGAAVAAGLILATKSALEFDKAMAEVSTLLDGSSTESMAKLGKSVKDLSVQFAQSPIDQARALYQVISAGASDSATQMEQLTIANKLAVGGVTDVATAADGLTTVINAYAGSGLTAEQISDSLFTTMKNGKTTIGELSASIGSVATIAAQVGVGFNELGAAIGTITKSGIATSEAMSSVRSVLSAVLKQSADTQKAAKELGIEFNVSALKAKGLAGVMADIANSGATEEQLQKLVGRVEGLSAVMSLGANNAQEFTAQLKAQAEAAGATDEATRKVMESASFRAEQAAAAFAVLRIEIGEKFLSAVSGLATGFVTHFDTITNAIEAFILLISIRATVAVAASFLAMAGNVTLLATAMAFLGGPVGIAALALGGLVLIFREMNNETDPLKDSLDELKESVEGVTKEWIKQAAATELIAKQTELRKQ